MLRLFKARKLWFVFGSSVVLIMPRCPILSQSTALSLKRTFASRIISDICTNNLSYTYKMHFPLFGKCGKSVHRFICTICRPVRMIWNICLISIIMLIRTLSCCLCWWISTYQLLLLRPRVASIKGKSSARPFIRRVNTTRRPSLK